MTRERPRVQGAWAVAIAAVVCLAALGGVAWQWRITAALIEEAKDAEAAVTRRLEEGNTRRALHIARYAVEKSPLDPAARRLYAHTLLENGQEQRALRQYERLFALRERPNPGYRDGVDDPSLRTSPTSRPFFYAPARLDLARRSLARNEVYDALRHVELARAYGQPMGESLPAFLYGLYAGLNRWERAFDFIAPEKFTPDNLPPEALDTLARTAAANGWWPLCLTAAEAWTSHQEDSRDAQYWLGRARLALGDIHGAAGPLERAYRLGSADAAYFIGFLREIWGRMDEAIDYYSLTPNTNVYRPFALSRAITIIEATGQTESRAAQWASLNADLRVWLGQPLPLAPTMSITEGKAHPTGFILGDTDNNAAGPVQLLTRWTYVNGAPNPEGAGAPPLSDFAAEWKLVRDNTVIDLRWVDNLVPFGRLASVPPELDQPPGWPPLYRQVRPDGHGAIIGLAPGENGAEYVFSSPSPEHVLSQGSIWLPLGQHTHFLLAVRCKSDGARLNAGWLWYDESERLVDQHNVLNQQAPREWVWALEFKQRPPAAAYVQPVLGIYQDAGRARYTDVAIFPLTPPF